mgnify:CR=1 FL=1
MNRNDQVVGTVVTSKCRLLQRNRLFRPNLWRSMKIIMGYNSSDNTAGWEEDNDGLLLYYSHFSEDHVIQGNHDITIATRYLP